MSVDLGSEYMKIAIVKPGVPMEIALNDETKRKTSVAVSMRDGERVIGDNALFTQAMYPKKAYWYLQSLLGKTTQNPEVRQFQKRFPYYEIVADDHTKMVKFVHDEKDSYNVEELFGMILEKARTLATKFAEQPINEAVITVPPYFAQAERRAMLRAGELAGMKVLQIMNENTAVALNYGVFRRKSFNGTAQHVMFFNMGSTSTTATIASYQVVKAKSATTGVTDTFPQITISGVGFDRNLGGLEFDMRLRDHLAKVFNAQKKTDKDITKSDRAMAKLLKEASRVKKVLSANAEHYAQIEGLIDEKDYKAKVTREELEQLGADLYPRVTTVVEEALDGSEVTLGELSDVILFGGGSRVPKIQDVLKQAVKRESLGKSINTDEASALGAVYQAAHLSKGFRVKKFNIKESNIYPIVVEFDKIGDDGQPTGKTVKRVLFNRHNPYPQKKVMTFNKHTKDFQFKVNYGDLSYLTEEERNILGATELFNVQLKGVEDAINKHSKEPNTTAKGVKAHFSMDDSGVLHVSKVESVFETIPAPEEEEKSTFEKIGSTISGLFGGGSKDEENKTDTKEAEKVKEEAKKEDTKTEDKKEEKKEDKNESKKKDEKDGKKSDDKAKKEDKKEKKKEPPKPVTYKENIDFTVQKLDVQDPDSAALKTSQKKIDDLRKHDEEKQQLGKAKNDLESFMVDMKDKLYQEDYEKCSTEDEREKIRAAITAADDWMFEQDDAAGKQPFIEKLGELRKLTKELLDRVKERQERPRALDALKEVLNYTEHFHKGMENFTSDEIGEQPFTSVEYKSLGKLLNDTRDWRGTILKEQAATPDHEKPKLLVEDVARKIQELDREVKYLISKAKYFKPKPKPKPEKPANATKAGNDTDSADKADRGEEKEPRTEEKGEGKKSKDSSQEKIDPDKFKIYGADGQEIKLDESIFKNLDLDPDKLKDAGVPGFVPPPRPGDSAKRRPKSKRDGPTGDQETLQLDGAGGDDDVTGGVGAENGEQGQKSSSKDDKSHKHDPDDEL